MEPRHPRRITKVCICRATSRMDVSRPGSEKRTNRVAPCAHASLLPHTKSSCHRYFSEAVHKPAGVDPALHYVHHGRRLLSAPKWALSSYRKKFCAFLIRRSSSPARASASLSFLHLILKSFPDTLHRVHVILTHTYLQLFSAYAQSIPYTAIVWPPKPGQSVEGAVVGVELWML
jgi:hypothetical protein